MTARDEIAAIITDPKFERNNVVSSWPDDEAEAYRELGWSEGREAAEVIRSGKVADAILAAGYVKPRVITTLEELDALPRLSVVQVQVGKTAETWIHEGRHALHFMGGRVAHGDDRARFLPLTVLWEPTP